MYKPSKTRRKQCKTRKGCSSVKSDQLLTDGFKKVLAKFEQTLPTKARSNSEMTKPSMRSAPGRDMYGSLNPATPPRKVAKNTQKAKSTDKHENTNPIMVAQTGVTEQCNEYVVSDISEDEDITSGFLLKRLKELLLECEHDMPKKPEKDWITRRHFEETKWKEIRPTLFDLYLRRQVPYHGLCQMCDTYPAKVMCRSCSGKRLCGSCDYYNHKLQPEHERYQMKQLFLDPLPPCQVIDPDSEVIHKEFFLPVLTEEICACGEQLTMSPLGKCILVTLKGRFDIYLPKLQCHFCLGTTVNPTLGDVINSGFWPGSSTLGPRMYIFSSDVIEMFDVLKKEKPTTSVRSFLSSLEQISSRANRHNIINPTVFSNALREWRIVQKQVTDHAGLDAMVCPACDKKPHAVCEDGNKKTYKFMKEKYYEPDTSYCEGKFLSEDNQVNDFVNFINNTGIKTSGDSCGQSHYQAARVTGRSFKNLDETGTCVAVCRHCVFLTGLNMYRGEIFAYPLYLLVDLIKKGYELNFVSQDVICRFYPWLLRVLKTNKDKSLQALKNIKPYLGTMHGKTHSWACQTTFGGRSQEGAGFFSGEESELCFSYFSLAGHCTKNMSKTARRTELTEMVLYWNYKKIQKLHFTLATKYVTASKKLEEEKLKLKPGLTRFEVNVWKKTIMKIASDHQDKIILFESDLTDCEKMVGLCDVYDDTEKKLQRQPILQAVVQLDKEEKLKMKSALLEKYNEGESALLRRGLKLIAERACQNLQPVIELSHNSIQSLKFNIEKTADHNKKRHKLRKKMAEEKSRLQGYCMTFNCYIAIYDIRLYIPDEMLSMADPIWPWILQSDDLRDTMSLKEKQKIVNDYELVARLEEEKIIVLKEMEQFITHLQQKIKANMEKLKSLHHEGRKAVLAKETSRLSDQCSSARTLFLEATDGQFSGDDNSPNDNIQLLLEEFEIPYFPDEHEEEQEEQ